MPKQKIISKFETGLNEIGSNFWLSLLVLLLFDALGNPYAGIVHDARLYALQALSHIHPERYAQDLFILFNSQDRFTIFSPVYAFFIKFGGLSAGSYILYMASKGLFFTGLLLFFRALCKNKAIAFAAAAIVSVHDIHYIFFDVNEPFLTPRLVSMGWGLFAFRAVLKKEVLPVFIFLLLAILFHPVMALGVGMVIGLVWIYQEEWYPLFLSGSVLIVCFVLIIVFQPDFFRQLNIFASFDPEWRAVVFDRASYLFPGEWPQNDWLLILSSTAITVLGYHWCSVDQKQFLAATLTTIGITLFLTSLFTYLTPFVFPIQIQPWRATWILRILTPLIGLQLVCFLWEKIHFRYKVAAIILGVITFTGGCARPDDYLWLILILSLVYLPAKYTYPLTCMMQALILTGLLFALVGIPLFVDLIYDLPQYNPLYLSYGVQSIVSVFGHFFPVILFFGFVSLYIVLPNKAFIWGCLFFLFFLFVPGTNPNIDYNLPDNPSRHWYIYQVSNIHQENDSEKGIVPPGSLLIPVDGISASDIWFKLNSSCYWSWTQGAAVIFNRELAMAYRNREQELKKIKIGTFYGKGHDFNGLSIIKNNPDAYIISSQRLFGQN